MLTVNSTKNKNMTDTNEQQSQGTSDIDPILQNDLGATSPDEPLLAKDTYELEVVKCIQARNKADTGNMIKIELKTTESLKAQDGSPVPAGRRVFTQIALQPTPDYSLESIQRALKRFRLACGCSEAGAFYPLEQYTGLRVRTKVGLSKATDDYPNPRNEVKGWEIKKA